ncbi:MAG: hypothetical protein LBQ93_07485 [Treponema sp.]|jgi:hypothetical protein|nr:hypothetical protein [Treponema sp.]
MALLKRNNNEVYDLIKIIFKSFGFGLMVCFIFISLAIFSFNALVIPSILKAFIIISHISLINIKSCLLISIEGSILGLIIGSLRNIFYYKKYYESEIRFFVMVKNKDHFVFLLLSIIVGFIVSFVNGASGLHGIYEVITSRNITINENTPIGQILSDWGVYRNDSGGRIVLLFLILMILIFFQDIIIGISFGIIAGLVFAIIEIMNIENKFIFTDKQNMISKKNIISNKVFIWIMESILITGTIGIIYGIIGSIVLLLIK